MMKGVVVMLAVLLSLAAMPATAGKKETKAERQARWAAERAVRVVSEAAQVEGCKLIGPVEGKGYWDVWTGGINESQAFRGLQSATHRVNGNTALIVTFSPGDARTRTEAIYRGEAYLCPPAPAPDPTPTPPQETPETGAH
jgi:hypothetical protein